MQPTTTNSSDQPTSLRHLVGQPHAVALARMHVDAVHTDCCRFPHSMIIGPSGVGKTELAGVIGCELAVPTKISFGQALNSRSALNQTLLRMTTDEILFIDEAHEMRSSTQTALFNVIDRQAVVIGEAGHHGVMQLPVKSFTLILATTDPQRLLLPLRNRCAVTFTLDLYSTADLSEIVRRRIRARKWNCEVELPEAIAVRSRGIAREAIRLLNGAHSVARSLGQSNVGVKDLQQLCAMEEIDVCGLNRNDVRYLEILKQGHQRLNVIASRLCLPVRQVSDVIEPYLMRIGFMVKDDRGYRVLTSNGREHLKD